MNASVSNDTAIDHDYQRRREFAGLFQEAPMFMALLDGPEHRVEFVNPGYRRLIGQRDIVGQRLADGLEDALAQGYLAMLDGVYHSGQPYTANGARYAMQAAPDGSIAVHHGGTVAASSAGIGHGSVFTLTLPLAEASVLLDEHHESLNDLRQPAAQAVKESPRRVVVVDDNRDAGASLAAALEARGHAVTLFEDAESLLAARQSGPVDAYVLDIGLPRIDGYQLARRLRTDGPSPQALFIALTGYGQAHDFTLSKAAGFDHHLVKPADLDELERLLRAVPAPQAQG